MKGRIHRFVRELKDAPDEAMPSYIRTETYMAEEGSPSGEVPQWGTCASTGTHMCGKDRVSVAFTARRDSCDVALQFCCCVAILFQFLIVFH